MTKIAINASCLQNNFRFRGPGIYTEQLLKALREYTNKYEFLLIHYDGRIGVNAQNLSEFDFSLAENWYLPLTSLLKQQVLFPLTAFRNDVRLFHEPVQTPSFWQPTPTIITIHDVIPLIFPEYYPQDFKYKLFQPLYQKAFRNADRIITVSQASKRDIIRYLNIPGDKIRVTYLGGDENFYPEENREIIKSVRHKYGISEECIFYVGGINGQKNIFDLLETYHEFYKKYPQIDLVIAGNDAAKSDELKQWVLDRELQEKVILPGFIRSEELRALYSGALFYLSTSLYEGFGLPFLEAMKCGTPVIGYHAGSIPEVVGDAGFLFEPNDRTSVLQAMKNLVENGQLRDELSQKGFRQAQKFSWKACANATVEVYEELIC